MHEAVCIRIISLPFIVIYIQASNNNEENKESKKNGPQSPRPQSPRHQSHRGGKMIQCGDGAGVMHSDVIMGNI